MGTRGTWGFYKGGVTKATYNHYDSCPSGLGESVRAFLQSKPDLDAIFDSIEMVSEAEPPTETQQKELMYLFEKVSTSQPTEWYALLRGAQGKPELYGVGLKYMIDGQSFLGNSLFCEWGYILNLDRSTVEVYSGFQKIRDNNRYAIVSPDNGYWHCKLLHEIPFDTFVDINMDDVEWPALD